jgi:hypothetical protein
MRSRGVAAAVVASLLLALFASAAAAAPGKGPRATVNETLTSTRPSSPTGVAYDGRYHATGKPKDAPPYMKRMVFYPPKGMRYDTSVPARCTATDVELQADGPDACPAGSKLGGGTTEGLFYYPFAHQILFDHYHHHVDVMNGPGQQIVLVHSEGYTVVRGIVRPNNTIDFHQPTCFPAPPTGCADNYIVQLASKTKLARYTKSANGRLRSYATAPPRCPRSRHWTTHVKFWWGDGKVETVPTTTPCHRR